MGSCTADCGSLFRCTAVGEADVAEKEIYHTGSKEHQSLLLRSIQEKWFKEIRALELDSKAFFICWGHYTIMKSLITSSDM